MRPNHRRLKARRTNRAKQAKTIPPRTSTAPSQAAPRTTRTSMSNGERARATGTRLEVRLFVKLRAVISVWVPGADHKVAGRNNLDLHVQGRHASACPAELKRRQEVQLAPEWTCTNASRLRRMPDSTRRRRRRGTGCPLSWQRERMDDRRPGGTGSDRCVVLS